MQKVSISEQAADKAFSILMSSDATGLEREACSIICAAATMGHKVDEEVVQVAARYDARHMQQDRFGK